MITTLSCVAVGTPRGHVSTRRRGKIFDAADGICCRCHVRIDPVRDRWTVEHIHALGLFGPDEDHNMRPTHFRCGIEKTSTEDVPAIRKADRQRARHTGAKVARNPFPGSKAHWGRQRKRMDGTVENRDQYEARQAARKHSTRELIAC